MHIENLRIKKPSAEIVISNLNNYSTLCCQNGKDTMIYNDSTCEIIGLNLIYMQYSKTLHFFLFNFFYNGLEMLSK